MPVVYRQWNYGDRVTIKIISNEDDVIAGVSSAGEGFVLAGGGQTIVPEIGKSYVLEFTKGGPFGGFWKVISEAP